MDSTHYKRPPWRRPRWITTAGVLALATIIALIVTLTGSGSHHTTAKTAGSPGSCPSTAAAGTIPTAPPSDLAWKQIGPMIVPTSRTAGPAKYDQAVWSCYAHSPMGAVVAAYAIFAGLGSPDWKAWAEQDVVPGQGQQAFIASSESQPYPAVPPGDIAQAVGFEVVSYTPQQATVEALASAGDGYQADLRTVAWVDGDWKMVLTPDGKTGPDTQLVTSAGGFVIWGSAGND